MKNALKCSALTLSVLASLTSVSSFADELNPCKQVKAACEAGGYVKGGHKKNSPKGLYKDCLPKILAGGTVEGVSVPAEIVAACNAKKQKHATKKAEKAASATAPAAPAPAEKAAN